MVRAAHQGCKYGERTPHHKPAAVMGSRILLLCLLGIGGCASYEPLDMTSYDPSHDQTAIAGLYRNQALAMREKANAQAMTAARYVALFGPEDDAVAGARFLAHYYEQTAQELERQADAHAAAGLNRQRPQPVR